MKTRLKLFVSLAFTLCAIALSAGELKIKDGETLAFLGDSITRNGWNNPYGYIRLIDAAFKAKGLNIKLIPSGIGGHKSTDMNKRMERDIIKKNPNWMTLSCGVNDVWHGKTGVPLEQYKIEVKSMLNKAEKAGIKVMILTPTMIVEDPYTAHNKKLTEYVAFLLETAKKRNLLIADLNADMHRLLNEAWAQVPKPKGMILTCDGVHMAARGDEMMARGILKQFGMTDAEINKIKAEVWSKIPSQPVNNIWFTESEYAALTAEAGKADLSVNDYIKKKILEILPKK